MSSWTPTACKTKNWSDYNHALKPRGSLSIWFDAEMNWVASLIEFGIQQHGLDEYQLRYKFVPETINAM